jgi:hypothetical protein
MLFELLLSFFLLFGAAAAFFFVVCVCVCVSGCGCVFACGWVCVLSLSV